MVKFGRHTVLRGQGPKGRAGSSPAFGTESCEGSESSEGSICSYSAYLLLAIFVTVFGVVGNFFRAAVIFPIMSCNYAVFLSFQLGLSGTRVVLTVPVL